MKSGEHLIRGTRAYRRDRRFQRLANQAEILRTLAGMSPGEVYAGLLSYARNRRPRRWKDGWAACVFKEIYGIWPRPQDKTEPACGPVELEEWINARRRRPKIRGTAA
jgi:hypothetical protein